MIPVAAAVTVADAAGISTDHTAPATLSVDHAHHLMQAHLHCTADQCPARRTALALLVAQERYVLAPDIYRR